MAAKLVVTTRRGGSQIALVGASGAELLASKVFLEPRAKGATLRSLKALMGDDVVVEDHTLSSPAQTTPARKTSARKTSARKLSARKTSARKLPARTSKPARKSVRSTTRRRTTAKAR